MAEEQFLAVAVDAAKNAAEVCPRTLPRYRDYFGATLTI
jgi:hypothetical protein